MRHCEVKRMMLGGVVSLCCVGSLWGCGVTPRGQLDAARVGDVWNPFAPDRMRISPLTHLSRGPDGRAQIVCHVELKDRDGLSVRGIGSLQVQLYRPARGGARPGNLAEQELKWDIDLSDLEQNRTFFDRATRTYRVPLVGAPSWVEDLLASWELGDRGGRVHLIATLATVGPRGEERLLKDEFFIEG